MRTVCPCLSQKGFGAGPECPQPQRVSSCDSGTSGGMYRLLLLCNVLLKPLVARPRPYTHRPDIILLIKKLRDYSFPSGHAAASFAAASALAFSYCRHWRPAVVLAVLISLSRLYLYVHYPSDVLCGALLGILCGLIGAFWSKKVVKKCRKTTK